ncbi:MAG: hypothetical protein IGR76_10920 [Synechococcales cyanobacterium T60_A2020_003]|nr:hypothetical protein [Synechococcales cyanobacterium T60_A2020_003]
MQVIHPDDFAVVIQSFNHAVQTQQPWRCTCRIVRSEQDGVRVNIWAIAQANVVEDQIVYSAYLQDVSELQQAQISCEKPLSDRQHNVEIIADAVPVGLYRNDADGNCVYINQETCKILDITFEK